VPRPNYFEYIVTINPAGEGKVVMTPDYPAYTVLRWTETFSVNGEELDQLYNVMVSNGLFTHRWEPLEPQQPGGGHQSMTVAAGGKRFVIESDMPANEEALAQTMYSAVTSTVPKAIWDKLNSQREEYVQQHSFK
jgi:hypothetical protein